MFATIYEGWKCAAPKHLIAGSGGIWTIPPVKNQQPEVVAATPDGVGTLAVALVYDRININLKLVTSKNETKELSEKLRAELDQVWGLVQKLEDKNAELTSSPTVRGATCDGEAYSRLQYSGKDVIEKRDLLRVDSEMGTEYMERRALARLSVAVVDKSHGAGEFLEKEKRTPKANRYYRNTKFLLGKDRLPLESNKKPKSSGGRKHSRESDFVAGPEKHRARVFKSCSNLLQRLMKHKHSWVFNDPVDATVLGLHDYHEIVQRPMDLGTIKSRLAQNFYKFPKEFAGDIRLTFCNAMTYNPKGQDVHLMAEQLLNIFEEMWAAIESEYNPDQMYASAFNPTSRTISQISTRFISKQKPSNFILVSRTHVLKKPKAKDPNKRDMTYEEKQKLGKNLQSLPSEKL
ncbi:hypothetical protein L6452_23423 [Arctium lappa]|uniref:Uncharacterized protein n=1 Tax=Arctium lappa TaxID=4217 RepID=A0ACB9B1Y5_ARCLA|nr:hypothetical protein L6452_23423 [Arctium lappa]